MKIISSLFIGLLFFNLQCNTTKPAEVKTQPTGIKEQVRQGAMLVDVRTPEEFAEGSIDGAINIPLDQVQSRVDEFRGKPSVIVFCKSGNRSGQAIKILEENGIHNVTNGINVPQMKEALK
ncbi:rhodanese-like domain-containing protein [Chryseobacterium sp.]|uniref:rhodanese-like domain-containing protein n=1 Tax=Chryseobacterium sp. TaxID=1871047 RepID=UPI0012AA33A8|nr:rhodanese-like domain-containing protein [Chryseobacterium sp.]QFG54039.1 rhodanese-like domain-containing protein [Chryseobacterium sp.]